MALGRRKFLIAAGVVTLFAVIGAVVAIIIWQSGPAGKSSTSSSNLSGSKTPAPTTASGEHVATDNDGKTGSSTSETANEAGSSGSAGGNGTNKVTSDPTKEKFTLAAYAVGDWGTTVTEDSCCKRRGDHTPDNFDRHAEDIVATVMGKAADDAELKPKVVIGHGDNFYWVGIIDKTDQAYRFDKTFESKFKAKSLAGIPWVNVMGNHDYGGASYICASGGTYVPCKNKDEIVQGLKDKFALQAEYKSPNDNRWLMKDHFYVHQIKDEASGVSIDIFNLDTNDADAHGAQQICCQCYGYSGGGKCEAAARGDKICAGGDTEMFDACMDQLMSWGEDSRKQLVEKVKASKATWKIVNAHYSPYNHYAANRVDMWFDLLKGLGVQVWINGHTHGEKHDYSNIGMHFIENGAGGGIINEAASGIPPYAMDKVKNLWSYGPHTYGFFDIVASKEWMRVRFITHDDKWNLGSSFESSTIGGIAVKHCYYIPVDGGEGQKCASTSADAAPAKHHKRHSTLHVRVEEHHTHHHKHTHNHDDNDTTEEES